MDYKLNQITKLFTPQDLSLFRASIQSPMLGGSQSHLAVLDNVLTTGVKIETNSVTRVLMSELYKMAEKFIVMRSSLEDKHYSQLVLLRFFRQHENEKLFTAAYNSSLKSTSAIKTQKDHALTAGIEYEKWQFGQLKSRFQDMQLDYLTRMDDIALISKKLQLTVTLMSQSHLTSSPLNTSMEQMLENHIVALNLLEYPCISMYYFAIKMIREPEELRWFDKLYNGLSTFSRHFDQEELKILVGQAINYCIRKHNSGERRFSTFLFDLYKHALDNDYLITNGYLSKTTYRNINTIALRLKNYEEAKSISSQYKGKLRPEEQQNAYSFNMANIHFEEENYDLALQELLNANYDDHLSNLFAKALQLKIYYKKQNYRLLDSHLDAMQVYLTRKKIIGYHKSNYSNLVKYTRSLIKLRPLDKVARENLKNKIQSEKILTDKEWLIKQLEK